MFNFFRRFQYRTDLFVNIMQLLILYPGGAEALKRDYPGIKNAMSDHAKQSTPIYQAAIMISASVLGDLASKVPAHARQNMIDQLRALDYERFSDYLVAHLKGETSLTEFDPSVTYGTMIFAAAFCVGDQWAESGKVERDDLRLITSEVLGALQGQTSSERSTRRISRVLDDIINQG
jgi:hypothetical protein